MKLLGSGRTIAFKTQGGPNARENHFARSARVAKERKAGHFAALFALQPRDWPVKILENTPGRFVVQLTRSSPGGQPLDDDNLRGTLKGYRDGIADRLGIDDGNTARIRWEYAQQTGPWGVFFNICLEETPTQSQEIRCP